MNTNRLVKIGRIPRGAEHYGKRDGQTSGNASSPSPAATSARASATTTAAAATTKSGGSSAAKATSTGSGEQGQLESDKTDRHSSTALSTGGSGGASHDGNNPAATQSGGLDTDADGNPIVTDENASYWSLIAPTGVNYLSSGWRAAPGVAVGVGVVVLGALV
ncbi:hypothetical protein GGI04_000028 [Coemansia thaxteri]|nr:hypothetical protein GGI04_000028 [Coemansia thaxteri]